MLSISAGRAALVALVLAIVSTGCATSSQPTPRMAANQPMVSVERFLQAANTGDLEAMGHIFGNASGSIADDMGNTLSCAFKRMGSWVRISQRCVTRQELELRMNVIALVLRHDLYRVRNESQVPGRQRPTVRIGVDIEQGRNRFPDVPFVVVQARDGRWLVEQIDLQRITQGE
jgi:hypothetical protein